MIGVEGSMEAETSLPNLGIAIIGGSRRDRVDHQAVVIAVGIEAACAVRSGDAGDFGQAVPK
jgi:hypothetical protein